MCYLPEIWGFQKWSELLGPARRTRGRHWPTAAALEHPEVQTWSNVSSAVPDTTATQRKSSLLRGGTASVFGNVDQQSWAQCAETTEGKCTLLIKLKCKHLRWSREIPLLKLMDNFSQIYRKQINTIYSYLFVVDIIKSSIFMRQPKVRWLGIQPSSQQWEWLEHHSWNTCAAYFSSLLPLLFHHCYQTAAVCWTCTTVKAGLLLCPSNFIHPHYWLFRQN